MNKLPQFFAASLLSLTFSAQAGDCPSLSGNYSIGKNGADFSTISDAVSALKCGGVAGPVDFLIQDGSYNEKISLSSIEGADAQSPIKFESKSGQNSAVVIHYAKGDATITMNGSRWIAFENLTIDHKDGTYGSSVKVDGKAAHLSFRGVVFEGVEAAKAPNSAVIYFSASAAKSAMAFEDCEINNGSIGISKSGMSAEAMDSKTSIIGTTFFNQSEGGIMLSYEDAPVISNNVVSSLSNSEGFKGISLNGIANNVVVSNNIVNVSNGAYGIAMNDCMAKATDYGQVVNNSIAVGGQKTAGLYLSGNTDNISMNFNRIKLSITGERSKAQAYYKNEGSGNNVNMTNNILYDLNSGGYTIIGNTYKDFFNQLPGQSNPTLSANANGIMIEKVSPIK